MLDEKMLSELKAKLEAEKARLESDLGKLAKKEGVDYETKFDEIGRSEEENADEVEEYMDNLGVTDTLEKNLEQVNAALERIANGTYGKCENCQGDIPLERLKVYPAASKCTTCTSKKA